ncbi:MAG: hypothetical protein NTU79_04440 [Planctomycetota bacterium]|nr:hypothetical protein [Planctomycetota bacterium]
MSFPKYPKYKDSGIEWLGDVPEHWEIMRVKHLTRSIEQGWSPQCEGLPVENESEWGVLKVGCVNSGTFNPQENKVLPADLEPIASLSISAGDLLISRANTRELDRMRYNRVLFPKEESQVVSCNEFMAENLI